VALMAAVPPSTMLEVEANGLALLVYHVHGAIHATSAICPHHSAWLIDGRIDGDCIDCPRHMGRFHIATGAQRSGPPSPPLPVYAVRIEAGHILVELP
jgi:nitrite reductase/ring-hydroxylating ferredoxin subunit